MLCFFLFRKCFGTFRQKMNNYMDCDGMLKITAYITEHKEYLMKIFSEPGRFKNGSGKVAYLCAILINQLPCYETTVNNYQSNEVSTELSEDEKNLVDMKLKTKKVEKKPSLTDMEDWF